MPLITDKFGKASISTDTAVATTVKTTRLPGVFVLEAFDLSKFAPDTPVFVVTYKKTTDPVTGVVSITSLTSWKALVNTGANTLTNLTVQPGYTDIGNAVGDFIECIPTSAWENSLIDGILTSLNPDGTMKTSAVQQALGIVNTPSVGWNVMAQNLTYTGNNGNGEYTGTFNGDVTAVLAPGMKLLVPRTVAPSTQYMSFVKASTQYAAKSSPTMGFTGNYTLEANLYLNSYDSTNNQCIMGRYDNASAVGGFGFQIRPEGTIQAFYINGSGPTSQACVGIVPLKKWVHIAVSVNVATKNLDFYINGVLQEKQTAFASAATSLAQLAVDFRLGAYSNGAAPLDGFLGECRIWTTNLSQLQIQQNMNVSLAGNEANLFGLWKGNGNFNDSTTNANNLTASGGASAVNLMSALGDYYNAATEYVYVTEVGAFGAGVTPVKLFGGFSGRIPNQTLGTIQYSTVRNPFGFPGRRGLYSIQSWGANANGATTRALVDRLLNAGIERPVDHVGYYNTLNGTGVFYLEVHGNDRRVKGATGSIAAAPSSSQTFNLMIPTSFFVSRLEYAMCQIIQASASVGSNYIIGSQFTAGGALNNYQWYMTNATGSGATGGIVGVEVTGE